MKEFNSPEEMEFGTSQCEMNINRAQFIATTANNDMIASGDLELYIQTLLPIIWCSA